MKFVFDLDGTICFKGQPVSDELLKALESLVELGHEVVFASARPIRDLLPVLHKRWHDYPMIGGNGSMVATEGRIMSTVGFDHEILLVLLDLLETYNVGYLIDGEWDYAYTGPVDHPILLNLDPHKLAARVALHELKSVVKILMLTSDDMAGLEEKLRLLDVVVHIHQGEGALDISPTGIHKWSGLQQLGIAAGEYVAFGNDANDISMFQHARHKVMIGDHPQLASFASEQLQLDQNIEHAIAERLKSLGRLYAVTSV
ncbi:Cof-type HAD-IIB family hydrolase [Paenibacillus sp. JCM 10914]|uniref:HAD-IIB family hydrolase n=1 Tax=Paenibacillus sp. JCM 10914 TaxID=1236974 RepID=UPI0003CC5E1E|nr:HAD family hydrolase [Paenibacillus sp. JCM 10914]GAE06315.1 hydrolase, putative [Paenibacillus sp. JCM 10914]